jgi:hypothetical protein
MLSLCEIILQTTNATNRATVIDGDEATPKIKTNAAIPLLHMVKPFVNHHPLLAVRYQLQALLQSLQEFLRELSEAKLLPDCLSGFEV